MFERFLSFAYICSSAFSVCIQFNYNISTTYMDFKISSKFQPTGDQPEAIRQLTDGVMNGERAKCCLA